MTNEVPYNTSLKGSFEGLFKESFEGSFKGLFKRYIIWQLVCNTNCQIVDIIFNG